MIAPSKRSAPAGTTRSGVRAWWTRLEAVDPRTARPIAPRLRVPQTRRSASLASASRFRHGRLPTAVARLARSPARVANEAPSPASSAARSRVWRAISSTRVRITSRHAPNQTRRSRSVRASRVPQQRSELLVGAILGDPRLGSEAMGAGGEAGSSSAPSPSTRSPGSPAGRVSMSCSSRSSITSTSLCVIRNASKRSAASPTSPASSAPSIDFSAPANARRADPWRSARRTRTVTSRARRLA